MKIQTWHKLTFIEGLMGSSLMLIFTKYPIFPITLSGDFSQHLTAATSIAHGSFPPFSASILYIGIELYLGLMVLLIHGLPALATVRIAMGELVFISPLIIYWASKEIFNSKMAFWTATIYTLSGFIWFGAVFNAGLYPNFWGLLSSLILVAATIRFTREEKIASLRTTRMIFLFALINAFFSHYSVLFVFPPLMLYLASRKNWAGLIILSAPSVAGLILFPGIISSLLPFATGSSSTIIQPTPLASIIHLPVLSFMVDEISANVIGDYAAAVVFVLGGFFLYKSFKTKDGKMLIFSAWFLTCLLVPVYSSNAWRFAFVGLMPLTVMAGWSLSKLKSVPFVPNPKVFFFLFLFLTPALGSWSNLSAWDALYANTQTNAQQRYDYQAIQWLLANIPSNCDSKNATNCGVISVNDFNFLYLPYMDSREYHNPFGGMSIYYAPFSHVIFTVPLQVQLFAGLYGPYIIVSKDGTASNADCDPRNTFGLSMTANNTVLGLNRSVSLKLDAVKGLNATVSVWDNGMEAGKVGLIKGHAEITGTYSSPGNHTLYLGLGNTLTSPMTLRVVDSNPIPSGSKTVVVPADFCQPWNAFNPASMRGWTVIYESPNVRLYEVNFR